MEEKQQFCFISHNFMKIESFLQSLQKNASHFSKIPSFPNALNSLKTDSYCNEMSRTSVNDFLKEIKISINELKITRLKQVNYQKFYESVSLIHAFVFLKKVFLKEEISLNCQFTFMIYLIFFLKLYRKLRDKKNRFFSEKIIQENFLNTMFIFSKKDLEMAETLNNLNFFKVNTSLISIKHDNNEFFESISTKLTDQTQKRFLVVENLELILFSKVLKTIRINEEFVQNKSKTELFLENFLNNCLKFSANLIDSTLKTPEISINLIQSLMNHILKIMVTMLTFQNLDNILYEKFIKDGFKEIKFLMKVFLIILFDDVHFDESVISKQEFKIFQPNKDQIKTLLNVIHLNSKLEKIKVFEQILQVNKNFYIK